MTRKRWPGLCLALSLASVHLAAQTDTVDALFDFMHAKFSAAFAGGREAGEQGEFIILANPGFPLTPSQVQDPAELSIILDKMPAATRVYKDTGQRFSDLYGRILGAAQTTDVESQADKEKATNAIRELYDRYRPGQPTKEYAAYLECQARYAEAVDALALARQAQKATGKPVDDALNQAVTNAQKEWSQNGFRARIGLALKNLKEACETNAKVTFLSIRQQYREGQVALPNKAPYYPVVFRPAQATWLAPTGWSPWFFRQEDLQQSSPAQDQALRVTGNGSAVRAKLTWTTGMILTVEVKRVRVARPWLETALFTAHTWRLNGTAGFQVVSTGNPADPEPGAMPLMITGILLARNLSLTWNGSAQGTAPAQVGPFNFANAKSQIAQGIQVGFVAPDPQIVAFFCKAIPRSPTPDPKLFPGERSKP